MRTRKGSRGQWRRLWCANANHRGVSEAVEKEMNERIDRGEGREPSPLAAAAAAEAAAEAVAYPAAVAEVGVESEDQGGEDGE